MTRLLLVDDHPLLRKGLAMTLNAEADLDVVGQAASAEEALEAFGTLDPDVALIDISLPGMSGLELLKHLLALKPDLLALVVSRHDESLYAERAVRAGAKGYVMKVEAADEIVQAVRHVLRGGIYMSEDLKDRLLFGAAVGRKAPMQSPLEVLSDRELEVFEMTGRGLPTREIAERLHLSVKTVESYRARIKTKLSLESGTELMQHAVRWVESESGT
ncbi:MAG: response regulator transcription factor [Bacteroidota bacterium]